MVKKEVQQKTISEIDKLNLISEISDKISIRNTERDKCFNELKKVLEKYPSNSTTLFNIC